MFHPRMRHRRPGRQRERQFPRQVRFKWRQPVALEINRVQQDQPQHRIQRRTDHLRNLALRVLAHPVVDLVDSRGVLKIRAGCLGVVPTPVGRDEAGPDLGPLVRPDRVGDFQFDLWVQVGQMTQQHFVGLVHLRHRNLLRMQHRLDLPQRLASRPVLHHRQREYHARGTQKKVRRRQRLPALPQQLEPEAIVSLGRVLPRRREHQA